jgi:hypothetical protein
MTEKFSVGDAVRVRRAYPPGHVRAPYFTRGRTGVIEQFIGHYRNPEELAYGRYDCEKLPLYWVRFKQTDLWPDYAGAPIDTTVVDFYENWLEPAEGDPS